MGKYFGTDGVRGKANLELTPELAFRLGRTGGYVLSQHYLGEDNPRVFVGRDTRISGQLLEQALIAGLLSVGVEVFQLGVISTPAVAYLTRMQKATAGIMISASHNPACDNGIKFFGGDGFKLVDEQELEIEALLDEKVDKLPRFSAEGLGILEEYKEGLHKYNEFLVRSSKEALNEIKVGIDAANGATSVSVNHVFADLKTDFKAIGMRPNGLNINDGLGSTQPEALANLVVKENLAIGLAFDGDGDRVIAVDELGNIVDGDKIMFIIAKFLKKQNKLAQDTVVTTVMSNLGFHKAVESEGINGVITAVGDRYVVEEMRKSGYNFGGEQSGHIIFIDLNTTGDGMLSGIQLLNVMKKTGKTLSELASEVKIYPQRLINIKVANGLKNRAMEVPAIKEAIKKIENEMNGHGRILVRPSGTEALLRIMAEADEMAKVDYYVETMADIVRKEIGV
ncbi:MAG: phosphoglucosamine mutase [Streptococcaceae bacterium]|jgi:phosphoglucosamine mutase|nr:phosphoglucosamine mutase [Streptococcaceae bacterium]